MRFIYFIFYIGMNVHTWVQFMGYKCFHFLSYTFLYFPNFYTGRVLSLSSDETKFLFSKTPTYSEMNNVLHLVCLPLLIWSTGAII